MKNLQSWFKSSLREKLDQLEFYIDDKFEIFSKNYNSLENIIDNIQIEFNDKLEKFIEEEVKTFSNQALLICENFTDSLTNMSEADNKIFIKMGEQQTSLDELSEKLTFIEKSSEERLQSVQEEIIKRFTDKFNTTKKELIEIEKVQDKISKDFNSALVSLESAKKPIQAIIDTIKNENLSLKTSLKELEKKNQELMKKIKKLEKGGI